MANTTEHARHGFTPEQMAWLEKQFEAHAERLGSDRDSLLVTRLGAHAEPLRSDHGGEVSMLKWAIGGLFVLGIAATGYLSSQIRSVEDELRTEIGAVRNELREEIADNREGIADNRAAIADLGKGLARIEAILEERLPRDR